MNESKEGRVSTSVLVVALSCSIMMDCRMLMLTHNFSALKKADNTLRLTYQRGIAP